MKNWLKLLTAAATLLLWSPLAQAQIKIGAVLSVTGGASFLGDPEKKTLEMYVADINAKGGVAGKKLELFLYDDASDPNNARTFATRLIEQDKVDALLAGSTTASTMAIIPLAEEAGIPPEIAHGDHDLGIRRGVVRASQRLGHVEGHRPGHQQAVGVPGRGHEVQAEPLEMEDDRVHTGERL